MKSKQILVLALALILVAVIVQNSDVARIKLLFWTVSMSMILLIFFTALIGFVIGYFTRLFIHERKSEG